MSNYKIYDNASNSLIIGEWVHKAIDGKRPAHGEIVPHNFNCKYVEFIRPNYDVNGNITSYNHFLVSINDLRRLMDAINEAEGKIENYPYSDLPF